MCLCMSEYIYNTVSGGYSVHIVHVILKDGRQMCNRGYKISCYCTYGNSLKPSAH